MKGRAALPWIALGLVLLGIAVLVGAPTGRSDRALDPRANGPHGAKAVVVLLRELGAGVVLERGVPDGDVTTALLLRDRFDDESDDDDGNDSGDLDAIEAWVEAGGVLVVADRQSPLFAPEGEGVGDGGGDGVAAPPCPAALDQVAVIGPVGGAVEDRGEDCFGGLVTARAVGAGTVVAVDGPEVFTNRFLGEHDNAVLAAALLAPTGTERVAFLQGPAGAGDTRLADLLGTRVAQALGQLAIAFGAYVLWRGRRLGRPVVEPQPVQVAGSELVTAVGRLIGARKRPDEAAARVRGDTRRALLQRLGLPAATAVEPLADAVAARTGLDAAAVAGALATRPVRTDADLVVVLADLDRIRDATLGQPATAAPGGNP